MILECDPDAGDIATTTTTTTTTTKDVQEQLKAYARLYINTWTKLLQVHRISAHVRWQADAQWRCTEHSIRMINVCEHTCIHVHTDTY